MKDCEYDLVTEFAGWYSLNGAFFGGRPVYEGPDQKRLLYLGGWTFMDVDANMMSLVVPDNGAPFPPSGEDWDYNPISGGSFKRYINVPIACKSTTYLFTEDFYLIRLFEQTRISRSSLFFFHLSRQLIMY